MPTEPYNPDSIFCKIADGQIPSFKVFENDLVYAFLDIGPLSNGHLLLIPKGYYPTLDQVPQDVAAELGRVMPKLAQTLMHVTGATAYNVLQNNGKLAHQEVMHVHFHLIPKFESSSEDPTQPQGTGLGLIWQAGQLDMTYGKQLAEEMATHLNQ